METMTLACEPRTDFGTRATRRLRETGKLPVVAYGHGEAPETFSLVRHDVEVALAHGVRMMKLDVGGKVQLFLIKDVQYDHFDHQPMHLDLARVDLNERVTVRVGIELRGVPKGISDGGMLDQVMPDLEVECLVTDIPDTLNPVVRDLGVGDSLLVKDLVLPPGVTATADGEDRVATVKILATTAAEEETPEGEEEESDQPEMIGRVRKDEDSDAEKSS